MRARTMKNSSIRYVAVVELQEISLAIQMRRPIAWLNINFVTFEWIFFNISSTRHYHTLQICVNIDIVKP